MWSVVGVMDVWWGRDNSDTTLLLVVCDHTVMAEQAVCMTRTVSLHERGVCVLIICRLCITLLY